MPNIFRRDKLVSPHWTYFKIDEKYKGLDVYYYALSGVYIVDLKGEGKDWLRDKSLLEIPLFKIPQLPASLPQEVVLENLRNNRLEAVLDYPNSWRKEIKLLNWTLFAATNATYNAKQSVNSGHAVDAFRLARPSAKIFQEYDENIANIDNIWMEVDHAVRDIDAYLYRIGYNIQLKVAFEPKPPTILI